MLDSGLLAFGFLVFALSAHLLSIALAIYRCTRPCALPAAPVTNDAVSLIRPVCGIDQHDAETLKSSFELSYPRYEVIFCCASPRDPAVPLVNDLIARHPEVPARLLIGDDWPTANPKLNNLIKGWLAARHDWVILADSNVLLPEDYIETLRAAWREDTGLVCSPPVGCRGQGFAAEIECAFLNTYQARWQLAADTVGLGFAQGKSLLWRRDQLDAAGGIRALGEEIAEDAAATKIVRRSGLRVRLVDRPFSQPLGFRSMRQVWDRQLRWARLRRATFPVYFVPEVLTGFAMPLAAAAFATPAIGVDAGVLVTTLIAVWYLPEALLNRLAHWPFTKWSPLAWLARDLLVPFVWVVAWLGNDFAWRGNAMNLSSAAIREARVN